MPIAPFLLLATVSIAFFTQHWVAIVMAICALPSLIRLFFTLKRIRRLGRRHQGKQKPVINTQQHHSKGMSETSSVCTDQIARYRKAQAQINQRQFRLRDIDDRRAINNLLEFRSLKECENLEMKTRQDAIPPIEQRPLEPKSVTTKQINDRINCIDQINRYRKAQALISRRQHRRQDFAEEVKKQHLPDAQSLKEKEDAEKKKGQERVKPLGLQSPENNEDPEKIKALITIRAALGKVRALCEIHSSNLTQEKRRLLRKDAYGNTITDAWDKGPNGIQYFIDKVLMLSLGSDLWVEAIASSSLDCIEIDFLSEVKFEINSAADRIESSHILSEVSSGADYEMLCEQVLISHGWKTIRTTASQDQGVDIIAEKSGLRVCVQCKYYSSPVGNSAVQEVVAGRLYWNGSHSVVVSNASYTSSAQALAEKASVLLMHHDDLGYLEKKISF